MQKLSKAPSFSDYAIQNRKTKNVFFDQVNKVVSWGPIEKEIAKYYKKGISIDGRPSYSGLLLFKLNLLQTWYGLSDYEVEAQANDSISFTRFLGLQLEDSIPDPSVISGFRTQLIERNAYEKIFQIINQQLEQHGVVVRTGAIVDASITDSPRKPKGNKELAVVTDREETNEAGQKLLTETNGIKGTIKLASGVDSEAACIKQERKNHSWHGNRNLIRQLVRQDLE